MKQFISRYWKTVSDLGINPQTPDYLKDKIRLTNRLVISLYIFIFFNFLRLVISSPGLWWFVLAMTVLYSSVLVFNRFGKTTFSRILMCLLIPVAVVIVGSLLSHGENYTVRMPILSALFAPVLLLDWYHERKLMFLGIGWNLLAQLTFHLFNRHVIPDVLALPGDINSLPNTIFFALMCSGIIIFGVLYFVQLTHESKERVRMLAEDLQKSNEVLVIQAHTISETNEELRATLQQVNEQNTVIARAHNDIIESIEYAKRIQTAILPAPDILNAFFPESFYIYLPKDIVSGDFYWFGHQDGKYVFLAAIDCTGHGVPGSFMSVMAFNQLNQIILERGVEEPAEILTRADLSFRKNLRQDESGSDSKDGMDLTLVRFELKTSEITVASAQRPYFIFRDGVPTLYKGDRFPVGYSIHTEKVFTQQKFPMNSGDRIYLFTDGITDQFGGTEKRKFGLKRLEEALTALQYKSIRVQEAELKHIFDTWKGNNRQLDDMMILGVEWQPKEVNN